MLKEPCWKIFLHATTRSHKLRMGMKTNLRKQTRSEINMSQTLVEIVHPLIDNGFYSSPEAAVRDLMTQHVLRQVECYRARVAGFEEKHGMGYSQFQAYVQEHARKINGNTALQKKIMLEEEDALDWKIAREMLERWLGLMGKNEP